MQPTRRHLLTAGLLGLGTACTSHKRALPQPPVDPDVAVLAAATAREQGLLDAYAAVAATLPHLADELSALSSQHAQHLAALSKTAVEAPPPTITTASPRRDASAPAHAARTRLTALEQAAARAHALAAVTASRALAPLLASLAACEASHAAVLSGP